jgi:hypothetical protein
MVSQLARGDLEMSGFTSASATGPSLDKNKIADLPVRFVSEMSREDLIHMIRGAQLPLIDVRTLRRLPFIDRSALERLAHLARRCCRTRRFQARIAEAHRRDQNPMQRAESESFWEDL